MKTGNIIRPLVILLSLLFSLLTVTIFGLIFYGVTIDLSFLKSGVEISATSVIERDVKIEGPVVFEFSTWPAIEAKGVQVANVPSGSDSVFFNADRARLQISLFQLLRGKIEIAEFAAEGVSLNLESNSNGQPNWVFGSGGSAETPSKQTKDTVEPGPVDKSKPFMSFRGISNIEMSNIAVKYHDASLGKTIQFKLEKMRGSAVPEKPMILDFEGHFQKHIYDLKFNGGSIEQLLSRGTMPWQFKLEGRAAGKQVIADGSVVVLNNIPQANLAFNIGELDVGSILSNLELVEGLEASVGSMGFDLSLKGDSLYEILQKSSMSFTVREGQWKISSPTSDAFINIKDLTGDIVVEEGDEVIMKLAGVVGPHPVKFLITSAPLVDYVNDQKSIPLTIETEFANSLLSFGGEVVLPITSRNLSVFLNFETDSLANLNELLRIDLPPIGPVSLSSRFNLLADKYEMPELDLRVGESRLAGKMNLNPSAETPEVNIELISDVIQINDFSGLKSLFAESKTDGAEEKGGTVLADETVADTSEKKKILSREILSSFNAHLLVKAEEVISGEDKLGSASLEMSIEDSLLAVNSMTVDIPGGGVGMVFDYLPGHDGVTVNLKAEIDKFDIGVLARRAKPETKMGGTLFLDVALHSKAPDLRRMMQYAKGNFDFGLVPQGFSAGIIDIWAVNLISAIMTEVAEEEQSKINCMVVRFGMEDGVMEEKAIYMDTSNMRVAGKADVDFKKRSFKIFMVPKAKRPEFFSLAVPIKVDGKFDDFRFGIGLVPLTTSIFSFVTSPIHVPFRRVFTDKVPEDGREACMKAWSVTAEGYKTSEMSTE